MSPSIWHILIVVLVVFLLFGSNRLPTVMEDLAKAVKSFKKGIAEEENTSSSAPREIAKRPSEEEEKG